MPESAVASTFLDCIVCCLSHSYHSALLNKIKIFLNVIIKGKTLHFDCLFVFVFWQAND